MASGTNEQEPKSGFSVIFEKPESLYRYLKSQKPFLVGADEAEYPEGVDPEDLPPVVIEENLSDTTLDGHLFSKEFTTSNMTNWTSEGYGFDWGIHSAIWFSQKREAPSRFYSPLRIGQVRSILESKGIRAQGNIGDLRGNLYIYNKDMSAVTDVDLGYTSIENMIKGTLENRAYRDMEKELIIAKKVVPDIKRMAISLSLFSSNEREQMGVLDFTEDEKSFTDLAQFFAQTYEEVIKALYQEAKTPLPKNPIVLRSPHSINTTLRLD